MARSSSSQRPPSSASRSAAAWRRDGEGRPGVKLAELVADRIVADVAAAGWPEGEVLGSEAELLERYGVSRAVLREAVRLLEHRQIGRMRRGPGGGFVVAAPNVGSVMDAVMVYLLHLRADPEETIDARLALEQSAAALAAQRLDEDDVAALRDLVAREAGESASHRELHTLLARATRNPAIEFVVELLDRVTWLHRPESDDITEEVVGSAAAAHAAIVESVLAGDGFRAGRRMRRHLEAESAFIADHLPREPQLDEVFAVPEGGAKLAESVARRLVTEIASSGWEVGQALGSESDLMERYEISRAALREAVRVLEHHRIARMRRGPGGGLFVTAPDGEATTEAVAIYLDRHGIDVMDLFELRGIVEMAVLDALIERLAADPAARDAAAARLERVLAEERAADPEDFPVVGHDLHVVLAELSGNRVLTLLTSVLVELTRRRTADAVASAAPLPTDEVVRVHARIVEAIVARDGEMARRRMARHLDALVGWTG